MKFLTGMPTVDYGSVFTWHRGSLLRYSSLWYTLHRVAKMNAFSMREFNRLCAGRGKLTYTTCLVHNRSASGMTMLDLERLAQLLGEPVELLAECDPSSLGGWGHGLFLDTVRICPECLRLGYHSVLFSLKILRTCPIHDLPLLDRCPHGDPIDEDKCIGVFRQPGSCRCGALSLFTDQTCRRPLMRPADLGPMDEVANWLHAIVRSVAMPRRHGNTLHEQGPPFIGSCTEVLALAPPPGSGPASPSRLFTSRFLCATSGIASAGIANAAANGTSPTLIGLRPSVEVASAEPDWLVFSAINRYIRRHVLGPDRKYCDRFVMSCDADVIAHTISDDARARVAWAYLLWMLDVRGPVDPRYQRLTVHLGASRGFRGLRFDGISMEQVPQSPRWSADLQRWVLMHATEVALLNAWRRARVGSRSMARSGNVHWAQVAELVEATSWAAAASTSTRATFFGDVRPGVALRLRPFVSKARRIARHVEEGVARSQAVCDACPPFCIVRNSSDSIWAVCEPVRPVLARAGADIKRHRLLGIPLQPRSILTELAGARGFAARLEAIDLEVVCSTPSEAIAQLRDITLRFIQKYGDDKLRAAHRPQPRVLPPVPECPGEKKRAYLFRLELLLQDWDFWCGGDKFEANHRHYLEALGYEPDLCWLTSNPTRLEPRS